jgi:hypothetical protein
MVNFRHANVGVLLGSMDVNGLASGPIHLNSASPREYIYCFPRRG